LILKCFKLQDLNNSDYLVSIMKRAINNTNQKYTTYKGDGRCHDPHGSIKASGHHYGGGQVHAGDSNTIRNL
jgi:hypothetical protein